MCNQGKKAYLRNKISTRMKLVKNRIKLFCKLRVRGKNRNISAHSDYTDENDKFENDR